MSYSNYKKAFKQLKVKPEECIAIEDSAHGIRAAKQAGMLTDEEVKMLKEFEELRGEIIKVNEFSFDLAKVLV